jgi:hypothetical protein
MALGGEGSPDPGGCYRAWEFFTFAYIPAGLPACDGGAATHLRRLCGKPATGSADVIRRFCGARALPP